LALGRRDLAAGEEHHVTARDQPVMASFAFLSHIGLHAVMAQGRIAADVAPLQIRERLTEELGKLVSESVGVDAHRHQGNPQPDIVPLMGTESTGGGFVLLDLVPVGWVVKPVDSGRMKEFLGRGWDHEHPSENEE
jgi:hypothetical protein